MKKSKLLMIVFVSILVLGGCNFFTTEKPNVVVCTKEAKICPDGSAVSRTGPNCEFTECPAI